MEIIILKKSLEGARKVQLDPLKLFSVIFVLLLLFTGAFLIGGHYGLKYSTDMTAVRYQQATTLQQSELDEQKLVIENARREAQENLDALATRLSKLQSHVMRLDALGSRLAKMADVKDIDFSASVPVGVGGPHEPGRVQDSLGVPDFLKQLDDLTVEIEDRNDKLAAIESMLMNTALQDRTQPAGKPAFGGWISSLFGFRTDPINGKREFHEGIDYAGKPGTVVRAVAAGIITWSARRSGFGNLVEINHGNGHVTRYAHNQENLVAVGDKVEKGQPIAIMGSTGRSTGTHVHFEVIHNGKHVDPIKYISVN